MCNRVLQRSLFFFILILLLPLTISCGEQQKEEEPVKKTSNVSFLIGIIPEHDLFTQKKRYQPLADYLSRKIDVQVELKILGRYGNLVDNFVSNNLDAAFFGSFTGAMAIKKLGVRPLVRPEWIDATSSYSGLIFTRKDSGIKTVQDMQGKRFAWVDKMTAAGWLHPLYYFKFHNIDDPHEFLGECYLAGTHEDAIYDVLNGKADLGAAKNTVFERLAKTDQRLIDELEILHVSSPFPANGLMLGKHIDPSLRNTIHTVLIRMDQDAEGRRVLQEFGANRFIETSEKDYTVVYEYAENIGLDLETYTPMND